MSNSINPVNEDGTLLRALNTLLRHRRQILASGLAVALLAAVLAVIQPDTYTSGASFIPAATGQSESDFVGIATRLGLGGGGNNAAHSPAFYTRLITSRAVLQAVAASEYTIRTGSTQKKGNLIEQLGIEGSTEESRQNSAVAVLRRGVKAGFNEESGIVTFYVTMPSRQLAQAVANKIIELVNQFNVQTRRSVAAAERQFIDQRLDETERELLASEREMQRFLQSNRQFRNSPQLMFEHERLDRVMRMRQEVYSTLRKSYEQARIDEVRNTPVITVLEPPFTFPQPDAKNTTTMGLFGLALGLVLGIIIAFMRDTVRPKHVSYDATLEEFRNLRRGLSSDASALLRVLPRKKILR